MDADSQYTHNCLSPHSPHKDGLNKPAVLIIDDDPLHLGIYCAIVKSMGFESHSGLVGFESVPFPETHIDLVLLDYHLHSRMSAAEIAQQLRTKYQGAGIFVLSDVLVMPYDIAPFVNGFIRKGDPARLVEFVSTKLSDAAGSALPS